MAEHDARPASHPAPIDPFGRRVAYRLMSVTDRRGRRRMAEGRMFLPKNQSVTLDRIGLIAHRLVARGARRMGVPGGAAQMRAPVRRIGHHVAHGLNEQALTINGTYPARHAAEFYDTGTGRVTVRRDSLEADSVARRGSFGDVMNCVAAGGLSVRISMVAMHGEMLDRPRRGDAPGLVMRLSDTVRTGGNHMRPTCRMPEDHGDRRNGFCASDLPEAKPGAKRLRRRFPIGRDMPPAISRAMNVAGDQ